MGRVKVSYQDKGNTTVVWHSLEKGLKGLQSSRRGAEGEIGMVMVQAPRATMGNLFSFEFFLIVLLIDGVVFFPETGCFAITFSP